MSDQHHYESSQSHYKKVIREVQLMKHLSDMEDNQHTVKILDFIMIDDKKEVFIIMNYFPSNLQRVLSCAQ